MFGKEASYECLGMNLNDVDICLGNTNYCSFGKGSTYGKGITFGKDTWEGKEAWEGREGND